MYIPGSDLPIEKGMYLGTENAGFVEESSFDTKLDPQNWAFCAQISFCDDGVDECTGRLLFEFSQDYSNESLVIDGNVVVCVVLEFEQDGKYDDEDNYHYTYKSLTICYESGDETQESTKLLPSKNLISAAERVFKMITRKAG